MMAELGGPLPRDGIEAKVRRDAETARTDAGWIKMIVPDEAAPRVVAGSVVLWSLEDEEADPADPASAPASEIGWKVLPEFQGRGPAKQAVRELPRLAQEDGRWGRAHAFPGVTNGAPTGSAARSASPSSAGAT